MANNNNKDKCNVPHLRFPEFSGEWKAETIVDACTLYNGRAYKQEELLPIGKYRVLRVGNFFTNDSWYYSDLELDEQKTIVEGDLLYAWSASFGPRFWTGEKAIYHYHIWKVIPKEHIDKDYLYHFLYKDSLIIKSRTQGGTMVHVTKGDMEKRPISFPCLEEQRKIAKLLSLLDERIVTQNKIIEKLQSLIKGLNDHILKNIEGDQVCFADLGEAYGGLSGKSGDDFGCGNPFITYMNVYQNTYISENDYELVQIAPDEKQNSVQYGDALFTLSSETPEEVGMGAVYLGKSQKLYLNSFCFGVHFHGNRVLPQYIAHFISSTSFRKAIYPLAQGSTRFNLQKQDFMRMKFVLPSLEEQERIATALDALHNHLANEKLLTEQYLLLKQFLLQQMFI